MREPYFKIGEEVILQSKDFPELNGEYVVALIADSLYLGFEFKPGIAYRLEGILQNLWDEGALRKKYPPSSEGFHDMISKIKDNVLEGVE